MKRLGFVFVLAAVVALVASAPVSAANSLTVTAGAALGGSNFGLSINVGANPDANVVFVQSDDPNDETHMVIRFRVRVDGLEAPATGAGRNFRLLNLGDDSATATPHKIIFLQRQATTGNWRVVAWTYTNSNGYEFVGGFFLANFHGSADRQIECEWTKATGPNNGSFHCFRTDQPGSQTFERTNIDDSNFQGDYVQVGFFDFDSFPGTAGAGQLDFDSYESFR